jgi:hypothetical protein
MKVKDALTALIAAMLLALRLIRDSVVGRRDTRYDQ